MSASNPRTKKARKVCPVAHVRRITASLSTSRPEAISTPRLEVPREPAAEHLLQPFPTGSSAFFHSSGAEGGGRDRLEELAISSANFLVVEH